MTHECATVNLATVHGIVAYPAAVIHGPFAIVDTSEGWAVIHRASGHLVADRGRSSKAYRERADAEARIRDLLRAPVDWKSADIATARAAWHAWKAGAA